MGEPACGRRVAAVYIRGVKLLSFLVVGWMNIYILQPALVCFLSGGFFVLCRLYFSQSSANS